MRTVVAIALAALAPHAAEAMCGCMVPVRQQRPDQQHVAQKILNKASKVALVRDGDYTILTMSNDVITELDAFGLIVPVPTVIRQEDVRVVEGSVFTALEHITNPRLIEQWDPEPCEDDRTAVASGGPLPPSAASESAPKGGARAADYG